MGHIAHLRKQFKSTHMIISYHRLEEDNTHYFLCENFMVIVLHLFKLESPSSEDALCQVWMLNAQWFRRRRFFNFVNVFSLFCNYLSLERGGALHFNKIESSSPKSALCKFCLKLAQWFWRRRFSIFVNVFSLIRNFLSLEKGVGLHLNKFEFPSPKDALCQVWLK